MKSPEPDRTIHSYPLASHLQTSLPPDAPPMTIEPITIPSITPLAQAYLVHNVLTPAECASLINFIDTTPHLNPIHDRDSSGSDAASTRFVSSSRAIIRSPDLASLIWSRLQPILASHDPQIATGIDLSTVSADDPYMVGASYRMHGSHWHSIGLNDVWRMARYDPGGHFGPHRDGVLHVDVNLRSMKTLMLYLNGGQGEFEGGTTNFVEEQELFEDDEGKIRARDDTILHRVSPTAGTCIIFNHALLHEGSALLSGQKYILRSEIMFSRTEPLNLSPNESEAVVCRAQAEKLESDGKYEEAVKWYRKAFKLCPEIERMSM
ncbi:hypothetical protein HDV00_002703 [Rhizophlyctis rosea]|nr:hypothetical protein HDV00_002703 [Rhizophlyctis rosea]